MKNFQVTLSQQLSQRLFARGRLNISAAQVENVITDTVYGVSGRLPSFIYWSAVVTLVLLTVGGISVGAFVFASLIDRFDLTLAGSFRIYATICLFGFGLLHRLTAASKTILSLRRFAAGAGQTLKTRFQTLRRLSVFFVRPIQPVAVTTLVSDVTVSAQKSENCEKVFLDSFWIISDDVQEQEVTAEESL